MSNKQWAKAHYENDIKPANLVEQQGYDDGTGRIRDWSGKQQVGEQQGDALDAVVEAICYDEHGIQVANVSPVVRERIRSALAARQPGAQVPVAEVSGETFNDDGTSDIIKPALAIGTKLYAAPPAQGIDQQMKEAITEALGCFSAAESEGWLEALHDGDIDRIRELWARRISYALPALQEVEQKL